MDASAREPVGSILPAGRTAWGIYAIVALILALSSVAPFVQLGPAGPSVTADDVRTAAVYLVTWIPFAALLAWYATASRVRGVRAAWTWLGHLVLTFVVPSLHSLTFLGVEAMLSGSAFSVGTAIASPGFQVLALLGTLQYLVLVAVLVAVLAGRLADARAALAAELELAAARLEGQLAIARVDALAAQLRPHFLFNTLNSISVLAASDPPAAQLMVRQLSALLRAVLVDGDKPTVPLSREVELLMSYVEIQRVRFGDRLRVRLDIDPAAAACAVPTLILQPLVENAVQYAIADREEGGTIVVAARKHGNRVALEVSDDGPGHEVARRSAGPGARDGPAGVGVGHRNTRERVRQLYGEDQSFTVVDDEGRGCSIRIDIPCAPNAFDRPPAR